MDSQDIAESKSYDSIQIDEDADEDIECDADCIQCQLTLLIFTLLFIVSVLLTHLTS
jgi:hypothetical protein